LAEFLEFIVQAVSTNLSEDLGKENKGMALSNENSSSDSKLEDLVDLLFDLQILNTPQKSQEEIPPNVEEAQNSSQNEASSFPSKNLETNSEIIDVTHTSIEGVDLSPASASESNGKGGEDDLPKVDIVEDDENGKESFVEQTKDSLPASPVSNVPSQDLPTPDNSSKVERESWSDRLFKLALSHHQQAKQRNNNEEFVNPAEFHQPKKQTESSQNPISPESQQQEKAEDKGQEQTEIATETFQQPEQLDSSPNQVFNRLIQSSWQRTQQTEMMSQSLKGTQSQDIENSIELFERWQRLLLTQEMMDYRQAIANFKDKLDYFEEQVCEPTGLTKLMLPLIAEVISLKVNESREDVVRAIAPIIDEMIQHRTQQDRAAMGSALGPVLPDAVSQQVINSPGDLARALGPEMSTAIKEQITLERDAMVDALYPVIGSTVSKYFAEVIQAINQKVESTLSLEGISRKIRAKLQGVSEAELIFRESMRFTIQAIFLIHKGSGLIIAEVQATDQQRLESEMLAGMLTAIRSFVNDVIAQTGSNSEIDQIEYGNSKIILEVAGYCYLAVVTQGEPPKSFIGKMRSALGHVVQQYGKAIESFDGDPSNVPEQIPQMLEALTKHSQAPIKSQKPKIPVGIILVVLAVLGVISIPLGMYQYQSQIDRRHEEEIGLALASDPELSVYRLGVDANRSTVKLSGKLPNQYLRSKAEQVAKKIEPKLKIQNAIIPVELPPNPASAAAEVKRVTNVLNQMEGTVIWADYQDGKVRVQGAVLEKADVEKISQSFLQIPGVKTVNNTVQLQAMAIASRVYFDQGSSEIKSEERSKITQIKAFLDQHPNKHLKLLGHTDPKGTAKENQELALERAKKVRDVLIALGVDSKRLEAEGTIESPIGVKDEQVPLLSRCVQFEIVTP
jgi:outer membrane protein OmpA-like peptidoglycan-associated protein